MKKYIQILSTKDVRVMPGLNYVDNTNVDAHVGERLRITSAWVRSSIIIKKGTGYYPAEIKNWNTVKKLAEEQIISFGPESDTADEEAEKTYRDYENGKKFYAGRKRKNETVAAAQKPESVDGAGGSAD